MNADFNVRFLEEQLTAEQMFNRASLQEFRGEMGGDFIKRALDGFQNSLSGIDGAIEKTDRLLAMMHTTQLRPEFEIGLKKHLEALQVNQYPRIGEDLRPVETLEDILMVLRSEFTTLRGMTEKTIAATQELQPQIDRGLFVATVLRANTPFNQQKVALGFGRAKVSMFMSYACHATILAIEDTFPLGFEFLLEPKGGTGTDPGSLDEVLSILKRLEERIQILEEKLQER